MDLIRCNLGFGLLVWVLGFIGLIQFQFQTHKLELAQVRYFLFSTTATISTISEPSISEFQSPGDLGKKIPGSYLGCFFFRIGE